jgi:pterin-4a-carbinolamine dehydratase
VAGRVSILLTTHHAGGPPKRDIPLGAKVSGIATKFA